jgi:hypothetical protein
MPLSRTYAQQAGRHEDTWLGLARGPQGVARMPDGVPCWPGVVLPVNLVVTSGTIALG